CRRLSSILGMVNSPSQDSRDCQSEFSPMPELPEVETVRRGLQPVMEGERIRRVEARRGDLRFPLQPDFARRLDGQRVTGLGRRAKYMLCDLASGQVLLM